MRFYDIKLYLILNFDILIKYFYKYNRWIKLIKFGNLLKKTKDFGYIPILF